MILGHRELNGDSGHQAGRKLLADICFSLTGEPLPEIRLTGRGKPYFPDCPLHFSITHTRHHVFCAVSEAPVGIDAEETDRRVKPGLADKILSPSEREQYDRSADRQAALLRFWVLKEAYLKLTGTGITGYPNDTDFDPEDLRVQITDGCYLAVMEDRDDYGADLPNPIIYKVEEL